MSRNALNPPTKNHSVTIESDYERPVTRNQVVPVVRHDVTYEVDRHIHHHDVHQVIQPVVDPRYLPAKHWAQTAEGLVEIGANTTVGDLYELSGAGRAVQPENDRLLADIKGAESVLKSRQEKQGNMSLQRDPATAAATAVALGSLGGNQERLGHSRTEDFSTQPDNSTGMSSSAPPPTNSQPQPRSTHGDTNRQMKASRQETDGLHMGPAPPMPAFEHADPRRNEGENNPLQDEKQVHRGRLKKMHPPPHKVGVTKHEAAVMASKNAESG